ncbi:MAG TPA: tRNA (adenosine(37)-N6)-dimethylallyltransferase MiaA [Gammaproteobacteria bacterium]|jgi:tRNA dimethylallyltransferase|nr:tRNA (adenosine(37)-N6)-dimethylallyltransferase MiaA [Gammaproteobacteria bacterium]
MQPVIFLMGPTASGKTPLAVKLVQQFPCDIISVDSAMVYQEMDIGTAKPDAETLAIAPHRLIDKIDPKENYSAGQFRKEALVEIEDIVSRGRIPLLVGGTMLYFRILEQGIAKLPTADAALRAMLHTRAEKEGWLTLHAELARIDTVSANRIHPQDKQRIVRALEVYLLTGKTLTQCQTEALPPLSGYQLHRFVLSPRDRAFLHERIALRFQQMLAQGFEAEVRKLYMRGDLHADLSSMRAVGYKQMWAYLAGELDYATMCEQAVAATRQLAKRQLTWLRAWPNTTWFAAEDADVFEQVARCVTNLHTARY